MSAEGEQAGETEIGPVILTPTLTTREKQALEFAEKIIERGKRAFIQVGVALMDIRDSRLYREDFATFEAYCQKRWGFGRIQAHRLIEAAIVTEELLPTGNVPTCERQARPLTKLEPEKQVKAWTAANKLAADEGRTVTTNDVEVAVAEIVEEPQVHLVCNSCGEELDEDCEAVALYECSDCGPFTRETSANDNHQCAQCNKFGSKVSDLGCPSCNEGELEESEVEAEAASTVAPAQPTAPNPLPCTAKPHPTVVLEPAKPAALSPFQQANITAEANKIVMQFDGASDHVKRIVAEHVQTWSATIQQAA